jgi:hypothetical protein
MSEIIKVKLPELVKVLMSIKGATPATFTAVTDVKMNKRNNPFYGEVTKEQVSNVFINFNYANAINKQRVKEGKEADFVPHERKWGVRVPGTPLILHKNNYYLEARFLKNEPKVVYKHNGSEIDKSVLEAYMPAKRKVASQNLENDIIIRDFKISNIRSIKFGGKTYVRTDV